jgi:hypothetical protein
VVRLRKGALLIRLLLTCRLNATSDPAEQLTFSTHLVHPAVIAAGEIWARNEGARKIVMQGELDLPLVQFELRLISLTLGTGTGNHRLFIHAPSLLQSHRRFPMPKPLCPDPLLSHSRRDTLPLARPDQDVVLLLWGLALVDARIEFHQAHARRPAKQQGTRREATPCRVQVPAAIRICLWFVGLGDH